MPTFNLPIGYQIVSLKADMNECCNVGGPFLHPVQFQLECFNKPESRDHALFKIKQMAFFYADCLMKRFPDLERTISTATLAMQIVDTLIQSSRSGDK